MQTTLVHVLCNRSPRTTAKVQHPCACREVVDKAVVPDLIVPRAILTVTIPRRCVLLVVFDDLPCKLLHGRNVGQRPHFCGGSKGRSLLVSRRCRHWLE